MCDVVRSEEGGADVADEAADAVNCEDVEGIVDAEEKLELGRVVGKAGTERAEDESGPERDVSFRSCRSACKSDHS